MCAMVMSHVDELRCALDALERGFHDSFRAAYECHDCSVCGLAGIYIKDLHSA
jgi:hypothetical protein